MVIGVIDQFMGATLWRKPELAQRDRLSYTTLPIFINWDVVVEHPASEANWVTVCRSPQLVHSLLLPSSSFHFFSFLFPSLGCHTPLRFTSHFIASLSLWSHFMASPSSFFLPPFASTHAAHLSFSYFLAHFSVSLLPFEPCPYWVDTEV